MRRLVPLADLGTTAGFVYHYTKASTALEHILPSMTLRLGPIADTNDPAESPRPATARGTRDTFSDLESAYRDMAAVMHAVHDVLARARAACLSVDDRSVAEREPDYLRLGEGTSASGWALDRMWAQYADGHRGMCLVLDREKLVNAFHAALSIRGKCLSAEVEYSDKIPRLPVVVLDDAVPDPRSYAVKYREEHVHARYFLKRRDWAGEHEFRLVFLDDADPPAPAAFVPIREALVAVMVGHRFPSAYLPCIEQVCDTTKIASFQFRYSSMWPYPRAVPYGLGGTPPSPPP